MPSPSTSTDSFVRASFAFACVTLPDSLSDEEGALVEPTEVAVRAVNKAPPRFGMQVLVLGGGTVGLLILQVARAGESDGRSE